ncbi:MAG: hypothetical protein ACREAA_09840 [Candidatus Polarisedimenticolia bacterium]
MRFSPRRPAVLLALITCLALLPSPRNAEASSSEAWVVRNREDLERLKLDGVALTSEGTFRLSARVSTLLDAAQPNLWCLARDAQGRIYAGGGNEGKVFRLSKPGAEPEVMFDSEQLEVHALALDSRGRLYAATSPRGAVYLVSEGGQSTVIFDPGDTYIWAMAFDAQDRLYVATGQKGRVYRVDSPGPNAAARPVLESREDHIRSLAPAAGGAFYAGSDQNGIIYRIAPDGTSSVVYDSPMREIAALMTVAPASGKGEETIYAAAVAPLPRSRGSGGPAASGGVTRIRVTADDSPGGPEGDTVPGGGESGDEGNDSQRAQPARPQAPPEAYHGAVYELTPKGYARKIWESREALPLALAPAPSAAGDGKVLVGTGNEGRVLLVGNDGEATDYVRVGSQQVTALLPESDGGVLAAASNLGQVARITPALPLEGTVTSTVHDTGFTSTWGAIAWKAEVAGGSSVTLRVRTGNTEHPDGSWSDWSRDYTVPEGTPIDRPRARYVQWMAVLRSGSAGRSPILRDIQVNYLQDNLPPEVVSIDVMAPGVVLSASGERSGDVSEGGSAARRAQNQPRRSFEKGRRSVTWRTEDANDDTMHYDVHFRSDDETLWKPLATGLQDEFYAWDVTTMPDGVYRLRVSASDAPSNPPGSEMVGSRVSMPFDVDNTPPVVGPVEARLRSREADVEVQVTDSFSAVEEVAYSLDAGAWVIVLPVDRIADATRETFRFRTPALEVGEHTITVRARDRAGNVAAGKAVIEVTK